MFTWSDYNVYAMRQCARRVRACARTRADQINIFIKDFYL